MIKALSILAVVGLAALSMGAAKPSKPAPKPPPKAPVAVAQPAPPAPIAAPPAPATTPLLGWDKIRFGMTGGALTAAYPGVQWTEEAAGPTGGLKRTFRTQIDGAAYDVVVILAEDRVARLTLAKVLPAGLDEAACKASFAQDDARLRNQYGPPTETSVRGDRWQMGGGSRLFLLVMRLTPDNGAPAQCVIDAGFYPPVPH